MFHIISGVIRIQKGISECGPLAITYDSHVVFTSRSLPAFHKNIIVAFKLHIVNKKRPGGPFSKFFIMRNAQMLCLIPPSFAHRLFS